jgi:hypothetical protein
VSDLLNRLDRAFNTRSVAVVGDKRPFPLVLRFSKDELGMETRL